MVTTKKPNKWKRDMNYTGTVRIYRKNKNTIAIMPTPNNAYLVTLHDGKKYIKIGNSKPRKGRHFDSLKDANKFAKEYMAKRSVKTRKVKNIKTGLRF